MLERSSGGLVLILAGLGLVVVGFLVWVGAFSWFGRLPGDIRIERPGYVFYAPITSMVIISLVLTAVLILIRRFWE